MNDTTEKPAPRGILWTHSDAAAVFLPTSGGWLFLILLWLFLFGAPSFLLFDGAIARHISSGQHMIEAGGVTYNNWMWAVNPDAPWLTISLLSDLLLGALCNLLGLRGVVLVAAVVIATAMMWCYQMGRARGITPLASWILFLPVLFATTLQWLARPHIFSYLFFLGLIYVNWLSKLTFKWRLLANALLCIGWVNFHSSVQLALFLLVLKPSADWFCAQLHYPGNEQDAPAPDPQSPATLRDFLRELSMVAVCALAIMVNVRGPAFYTFLLDFVNSTAVGAASVIKNNEWSALDLSAGLGAKCFLLAAGILIIGWSVAPRRARGSELAAGLAFCLAGICSMRLIPYFCLLAFPFMAAPWQSFLQATRENLRLSMGKNNILQRGILGFLAFDDFLLKRDTIRPASVAIKLALAVATCAAFLLLNKSAISDFANTNLPSNAALFMEKQKISDVGFTENNWAPYLNWRLKHRIFSDDRAEFYPRSFNEQYIRAYSGLSDWSDILDKYKLSYVLVRPDAPLRSVVDKSPVWKKVYEDKLSVLYVRAASSAL